MHVAPVCAGSRRPIFFYFIMFGTINVSAMVNIKCIPSIPIAKKQ
jgi:hypothetical protein